MDIKLMQLHQAYGKHVWAKTNLRLKDSGGFVGERLYMCSCGLFAVGEQGEAQRPVWGYAGTFYGLAGRAATAGIKREYKRYCDIVRSIKVDDIKEVYDAVIKELEHGHQAIRSA